MAILLFSSNEPASQNIAEELFGTFEQKENFWKYNKNIMVDIAPQKIVSFNGFDFIPKEKLDWKKNNEYIIVLSPHRSESKKPSLTVHTSGNWGENKYGGEKNTLSIANPEKMLLLLEAMNEKAGKEIEVSYEVDHHGPSLNFPITFVELGSEEQMHKNKKYAKIIAECVLDAISKTEKVESYIGLGGTHYASKQTKIALEKGIAFGHMLSKHNANDLNEKMLEQALEKTNCKTDAIFIDKKGLPLEQRETVKKFCKGHEIEIVVD